MHIPRGGYHEKLGKPERKPRLSGPWVTYSVFGPFDEGRGFRNPRGTANPPVYTLLATALSTGLIAEWDATRCLYAADDFVWFSGHASPALRDLKQRVIALRLPQKEQP